MKETASKIWNSFCEFFSHESLREKAKTIQYFNIVEIVVIVWAGWEVHRLLNWYMDIMTAELFNPVAFWGAVGSIIAAVFGALNFMNKTLKEQNDKGH